MNSSKCFETNAVFAESLTLGKIALEFSPSRSCWINYKQAISGSDFILKSTLVYLNIAMEILLFTVESYVS